MDKEFTGEAKAADGTQDRLPASRSRKLDPTKTVCENVAAWCEEKKIVDRFNAISVKLGEEYTDELMEEMTALQEKIDAADAWDIDAKIEMAMDALRCPPDDCRRRQALGRRDAAASRSAVCCCPSPTCCCWTSRPTTSTPRASPGCSTTWTNFPGCVILVTHDRYFLDQVTKWTLELDRGKGIPYEGNYSAWLEKKAKRIAQESREEAGRQKALNRELEWVRAIAKARQAKSKARLAAYEEMAAAAEREKHTTAQIQIPPGPRLGQIVIEVEHLKKAYGDKLLIEDLSFKLPPGGIVGVIGPNGAGKIDAVQDDHRPREARRAARSRSARRVKLGYVDQSRDALERQEHRLAGNLRRPRHHRGRRHRDSPAAPIVGAFNFKGADQQKKVGQLSGGERNRVHLAKMLTEGANLILLDEPTNDLDVETLQALEAALEDFAGCAVVISHDRWFLDRLATHILAFEGDSHVEWFEGNFEAYEEDKKRRLGADAIEPKRPTFKKFAR